MRVQPPDYSRTTCTIDPLGSHRLLFTFTERRNEMKAFSNTWLSGLRILFKVFLLSLFMRILYELGAFSVLLFAAGISEITGEEIALYLMMSIATIVGLLSIPFMVAVIAEHVNLKG